MTMGETTMKIGDRMTVSTAVKGALSGRPGVIVETEQIPHGSLLVRCQIIADDTDATLWWLSRREIVLG